MVKGIFYPENPEALALRLASWGLMADVAASGGQAIFAPHGAWDLTGSIAARAFARVQGKNGKSEEPSPGSIESEVLGIPDQRFAVPNCIKRVLLLGTHHNSDEEGIYLSESASFAPGLRVDQQLNRRLASCSTLIKINDIPHLSEHSLEVLLPLVKYCFPEVKIIPILMSGGRPALISSLARALRISFEEYMEESLIVISSTVSQNPDPAAAHSMADEFRTILEAMDTRTYLACLAAGRISACGGALLGALLESGLLEGKRFTSLCPLAQGKGENGETVYYGAFGA